MIYLLYVTALLNVALGAFTFFNQPRSRKNIFFFLITIGIALWAFTNAQFQISVDANEMYAWAVWAYISADFLIYSVRLFSLEVAQEVVSLSAGRRIVEEIALVFSIVAPLMTGVVATGVDFETKSIKGGPLLPLLFVFYVYLMTVSLNALLKKYRLSIGRDRKQNLFVFLGLFGAIVVGISTNIVLPAFGIYLAVTIGPSFTLFFLGVIAYAIIRHRLFDIRVLVGRIVYYITAAIVPYIIFFFVAWMYQQLFETIFSLATYIVAVPVALAFVFSFNGINHYIRNQVNSRLINPGYDPLETSERFTNEVSLVLDVDKIVDLMQGVIKRTVRPNYSAIVVYGEEQKKTENEIFITAEQENLTQETVAQVQQITNLLWQTLGKHPIVLDNIQYELEVGIYKNTPNLALEAEKIMQRIGAKVVLQLSSKESVRGLYIIGEKEADVAYSVQDLDFLTTLANTCSVALERSLLYNEVQDFANTLQDKVDQATEELLKTNTELESALEQVQEARRKERDMIDVMGHELRTPISIVRNALAMMQREREKHNGVIEADKLEKYLSMGLESARREITLIETLLSATKVDASRLQLYLVQVPLSDVVRDGIEGQKTMLSEKKLELVFNPPAEDVVVYADRTRIQEVMDNFLSNALKYTMQGKIEVKYWQDSQWGWMSISDTGMGIDEADLRNLGKKFFRAKQYVGEDPSSTQVVRPGGTGLGLYVTFELIRVMGGQLYINSQVGKGTTFTYCLPLHTGQADKQIDQTFEAGTATARQHIFINQPVPSQPK